MSACGRLYLVSVGPGAADLIPPMAEAALRESDVVVAYDLYLTWVRQWLDGKEIHTLPPTREKERATRAIELARAGRRVSLVSSGDIGIYAMAALVLEEMREEEAFNLKIVPGISAANGCASLLGSPLSHDFATLSLSDLLCPWEWIEERARRLARADMVIALYNVQSRQRPDGACRILRILLESKQPSVWCGTVRNAYRDGQETHICTLVELLNRKFDMFTTIIVGNRFTQRKGRFIYTPRGYNSWSEISEKKGGARKNAPAIWVFSGTSDGNQLAHSLAQDGYRVIVSAASHYGGVIARENLPSVEVRAGRMGAEARSRELRESATQAIVDATHPFAAEISAQLIHLSGELQIEYVRYERPASAGQDAIRCGSVDEAASRAAELGTRIFLATGSKDLATFVGRHPQAEWFTRVLPDSGSLERVASLGVPRSHICAMQGPFTKEFNEALWKGWEIDCVVTKDSGDAGGFDAKAAAAKTLGIPLIVIERPAMDYPRVARDFESVKRFLSDKLICPSNQIKAPTATIP